MARMRGGAGFPAFASREIRVTSCPVEVSLGTLGWKWALVLLCDIALYGNRRFSDMLRSRAGITPRILSMRLADLRKDGLIERVPNPDGGRSADYHLTEKGRDTIPILTALISLGICHHANVVFADGRPCSLEELVPGLQAEMLGRLMDYARLAATSASSIRVEAEEIQERPPGRSGVGRKAPGWFVRWPRRAAPQGGTRTNKR